MNSPRIYLAALVAGVTLVLVSGYAQGAYGTGTAEYDAIKIGRAGVGGVTYFNGSIVNETTSAGADNPVTFGDSVRIDGRIWRGSTQGRGDSLPVIIDDDLRVAGDITQGQDGVSLIDTLNDHSDSLSNRYENVAHLADMFECVADLAVFTTYVWSEDYIDCYNAHIAGNTFPVSSAGFSAASAPDEVRQPIGE